MRHLILSARYTVVEINSFLLTITFHSIIGTTLLQRHKIFGLFRDVKIEFDSICSNTTTTTINSITRSVCCAFHRTWEAQKTEHDTPAHRPRNHKLYDIPPTRSVFQVTQTDPRSTLMTVDYCRNM
jgi:hypothetical protein